MYFRNVDVIDSDYFLKHVYNVFKLNKKIDEKLMNLINDINDNYRYYSFDQAVQMMNMNPSYFSRFFHNMIGISFAKYLNCVRIEKAVEFLQNKKFMSMSEIAEKCGFQTIRNFNRIFKKITGKTPNEYKKVP